MIPFLLDLTISYPILSCRVLIIISLGVTILALSSPFIECLFVISIEAVSSSAFDLKFEGFLGLIDLINFAKSKVL